MFEEPPVHGAINEYGMDRLILFAGERATLGGPLTAFVVWA